MENMPTTLPAADLREKFAEAKNCNKQKKKKIACVYMCRSKKIAKFLRKNKTQKRVSYI